MSQQKKLPTNDIYTESDTAPPILKKMHGSIGEVYKRMIDRTKKFSSWAKPKFLKRFDDLDSPCIKGHSSPRANWPFTQAGVCEAPRMLRICPFLSTVKT